MAIQFQCPHCQKSFKVGDEFAGRQTNCPNCKNSIRVPAPAAAAPPPPATAPPKRISEVKPGAAPTAAPKRISEVKPGAAPTAPTAAPKRISEVKPGPAPAAPAGAGAPPKRISEVKPGPAPAPAPGAPGTKRISEVKTGPAPAAAAPPPAAKTPSTPIIKFQCSWCDVTIQVGLELEGRQTPCPECRRIVKVPLQVKEQPKDWRQVTKRPIPLKHEAQAAPTDAWGTGAATTVSRELLEKAGVITEPEEPVTRAQWIKRGFYVALAVVVIGGGFFHIRDYLTLNERDKAVSRALPAVYYPADKEPPLQPEAAAAIHLALGELYRRARMPEKALEEFRNVRGILAQYPNPTPERDLLLMEAVGQMFELGGGREQVKERTHLDWSDVLAEMGTTTAAQRSREARAETIRRLFPKLTGKKQDPAVLIAKLNAEDKAEAVAVLGLERWRAGQTEEAKAVAEVAQRMFDEAAKTARNDNRPMPSAPSLVTLLMVLEQADKLDALQKAGMDAMAFNQGTVEGQARLGKAEAIRGWIKTDNPPLHQLRFEAVLGAALLEKDPKDAGEVETVIALAEPLQDEVDKQPAGKAEVSWLLWRLACLAARGGHEGPAKKLAALIADPALRGRAQLEAVRRRLEQTDGKADNAWADEVDKGTPAHALAREAIARHNARHGGATVKTVDGWPEELLRPFGYMGVALGIQDREGK